MGAPVVLNIYDLSEYNTWMYWLGAGGVFHTGLEVYDEEYAFGDTFKCYVGHDYDMSGIFMTGPRDAPGPVVYRESIIIGETDMSRDQIHALVQEMGLQYKGNLYHLLQRNCNHFSDELAFKLCKQHAPAWVNRLAGLAVCLHCLLPQGWVPPLAVPSQSPVLPDHAEEAPADETRRLLDGSGLRSPLPQAAEVR